jgi:putative ABC transport system permease protein
VIAEQTELVEASLGIISTFLLVFAAVSVFVASFIIWNTFTILVAQRTREMALLRAVGATRRQVRRAVLGEAAVVGVVGSLVGLVLGAGVARSLVLLLQQLGGVEMPSPALVPSLRTALIGVVVGTVVTLVASIAPARRATRVAPVQALREALPGGSRPSGRRAVAGAGVLVLGTGLLTAGLFAGSGVATVGAGVLVTFVGVTVLLPLLATGLARVLGAPLAAAGTTGRLARGNAVRNPNRTASTAAALMIGLALVVTVSIVASSLKASIGSAIDDTVKADLVVQQVGGQGAGLSPTLADEVREVPGVEVVSEFAYGRARIDGADTFIAPVDPATVEQVLDLGLTSGSVDGLRDGGVLVHEDAAEVGGWEVGSEVPVSWASTGDAPLTVAGIFTESDAVGADHIVALDTYDAHATGRLDSMVLLGRHRVRTSVRCRPPSCAASARTRTPRCSPASSGRSPSAARWTRCSSSSLRCCCWRCSSPSWASSTPWPCRCSSGPGSSACCGRSA